MHANLRCPRSANNRQLRSKGARGGGACARLSYSSLSTTTSAQGLTPAQCARPAALSQNLHNSPPSFAGRDSCWLRDWLQAASHVTRDLRFEIRDSRLVSAVCNWGHINVCMENNTHTQTHARTETCDNPVGIKDKSPSWQENYQWGNSVTIRSILVLKNAWRVKQMKRFICSIYIWNIMWINI